MKRILPVAICLVVTVALTASTCRSSPSGQIAVSTLIASPSETAFEVVFAWEDGPPGGGTGVFVWRQIDGSRRLDALWGKNIPDGYVFVTDPELDVATAGLGGRGCDWGRPLDGQKSLTIDCGNTSRARTIVQSIRATHAVYGARALPAETIVGRPAVCYAFDLYGAQAKLCIDKELRAPLLFDGLDVDGYHHHILAKSVTTTPEPFSSMTEFPDYTVTPLATIIDLSLPKVVSERLAEFSPAPP